MKLIIKTDLSWPNHPVLCNDDSIEFFLNCIFNERLVQNYSHPLASI